MESKELEGIKDGQIIVLLIEVIVFISCYLQVLVERESSPPSPPKATPSELGPSSLSHRAVSVVGISKTHRLKSRLNSLNCKNECCFDSGSRALRRGDRRRGGSCKRAQVYLVYICLYRNGPPQELFRDQPLSTVLWLLSLLCRRSPALETEVCNKF